MTDTAAERARKLALKLCDELGCTGDDGQPFPDDIERTTAAIAAALRAAEAGAIERLNDRISLIMNNHLVEMKEGYDDSIVGFNAAWDIVREEFARALASPSAMAEQPDGAVALETPLQKRIGDLMMDGTIPEWAAEQLDELARDTGPAAASPWREIEIARRALQDIADNGHNIGFPFVGTAKRALAALRPPRCDLEREAKKPVDTTRCNAT